MTNFSVILDDGRTLVMNGDTDAKYSDFASGDMGMTVMVVLNGGPKPQFEISMITLRNDRCSHPFLGFRTRFRGSATGTYQKRG